MKPHDQENGRPPGANDRNAGTFIALGVVLFLAAGLIALMAIVIPAMLALVLLPVAFAFLAAFHYLAWGWWMPTSADEEQGDPRRMEED